MLLCNCKAKIKKVSTAFAIALMSARLEQTVCYKLPAAFSEKSTNETNCLVTLNVSNRSQIPPVAIWKIASAWDRFTSFFAKFGLQGWFVRFANGLGNLMRLSRRKIDVEMKSLSTTSSLHLGLQTYVVTSMRYAVGRKQNTERYKQSIVTPVNNNHS